MSSVSLPCCTEILLRHETIEIVQAQKILIIFVILLFECRIVSEYPVYIFVHHFNFEPDQINILT